MGFPSADSAHPNTWPLDNSDSTWCKARRRICPSVVHRRRHHLCGNVVHALWASTSRCRGSSNTRSLYRLWSWSPGGAGGLCIGTRFLDWRFLRSWVIGDGNPSIGLSASLFAFSSSNALWAVRIFALLYNNLLLLLWSRCRDRGVAGSCAFSGSTPV